MVTATGQSTITGTDSIAKDQTFRAHFLDLSATDGLTATAGGAQASVALNYAINRFTTVTNNADSCQLPLAKAGRVRIVINADASHSLAVFPQSGEIINALTADSSISVSSNKVMAFFCAVDGTWNSLLTA
jgi:hypothetical protein